MWRRMVKVQIEDSRTVLLNLAFIMVQIDNRGIEGVVFVLSGFVNPERGMLRPRAMEMGAEYKLDWNSNCTLLVCAFPNTPKFRQVEADCGTIVSKVFLFPCFVSM
ncbi:hypothetical protein JHK82_050176 [Glycine max]|nr:hypothetical protein JHK87_049843 [Glycine soja]KAG5091398.1 hypothetical protein JHK82_050176 [Glycine max]